MGELTCKPGMKLVAGPAKETDPEGKIAPFCIDEHEFTQEQEAALYASRPGAKFQLIAKSCGSDATFVAATGTEADIREKAAKLAKDTNVCNLEFKSILLADLEPIEGNRAGPRKPLVSRSWHEARTICRARGMDLPSDRQWEKAARGRDGNEYATKSGELRNDDDKAEACYGRNDDEGPCDVMSFPPNDYGLYDMTGGVWEWTLDVFKEGAYRHIRGGSWFSYYSWSLRADYRGYNYRPGLHLGFVGLRCVAAPQGS